MNIWADGVRRYTSVPHRIACVTDMPAGIDPDIAIIAPPREFEDWRIPSWDETRPQCLRRIAMFGRDAGTLFGDRFACMDLDCVIAGSLDPILTAPEDFRICRGTAQGRPYNGSLILMTAGARPQVYERFTREGAIEAGRHFLGSDQAWIAHCLGSEEATFGPEDGVQMVPGRFRADAPLTFYPGAFKPWHIVRMGGSNWVERHYRRDPARGGTSRGVYLGYGARVWEDARRAFAQPVDWVIASPEAAAAWTGPIADVVRDDREALRLARMLGRDLVICGASEEEAA